MVVLISPEAFDRAQCRNEQHIISAHWSTIVSLKLCPRAAEEHSSCGPPYCTSSALITNSAQVRLSFSIFSCATERFCGPHPFQFAVLTVFRAWAATKAIFHDRGWEREWGARRINRIHPLNKYPHDSSAYREFDRYTMPRRRALFHLYSAGALRFCPASVDLVNKQDSE